MGMQTLLCTLACIDACSTAEIWSAKCFGCVQGDLSLIAEKGHAGLPMGHIIAYKADHEMHIEFAKQLKASCSPGDWVNADKAS